ncbi:MAG: hypothetical protein JNK53_07075 [Phycisphaerae bacterium]|nr:hypothetical protein [Phycisphaerae bacterium]
MIIVWQAFDVHPGASKAEVKSAGRAASRAAFVQAAERWQLAHGEAAWQRASIVHDTEGAPVIDARGAPAISLTHGHGLAGCAIAAPTQAWIGLDAELTRAPGMRAVRELAARTGEHALAWPDNDWPARLWCAKEAVVKAERTAADLLGRTLSAVEVRAVADLVRTPWVLGAACATGAASLELPLEVVIRSHRDRAFVVHTARLGAFTVAAVRDNPSEPGQG